jgi:hypothetical protein
MLSIKFSKSINSEATADIIHLIVLATELNKKLIQKVDQIIENLNNRQNGNAHEESHQSTAIRNEIDESVKLCPLH